MYDKFIENRRFILPILVISIIYIISATLLMNWELVRDTVVGSFSIRYKFYLLIALLQGMWTAMSFPSLIMLFLIALLTGANLTLLFGKIREMKSFQGVHLVVGGNSLLGIIGSGCATCGLPILSLLGLGGSIMYLPYQGAELSYISFILLAISLYLLMKNNSQSCAVNYIK